MNLRMLILLNKKNVPVNLCRDRQAESPTMDEFSSIERRSDLKILQNFQSLDVLRGLLALYVIAGHARWLLWIGNSGWTSIPSSAVANGIAMASATLRYGHEAVMVFFALSGFFIHMRMARAICDSDVRLVFGTYAKRRIHRIAPPYILALLTTVAVDTIGRTFWPTLYAANTGAPLLDSLFLKKNFSPAAIIPACMFVPSACGQDFGTNGPLWSIGYEIVYYCLYPLWFWVRKRTPIVGYVGIPIALVYGARLIPHSYIASVMQNYPIWIAGAGLAELSRGSRFSRVSILIGASITAMIGGFLSSSPVLTHLGIGVSVVVLFGSLPRTFNSWKLLQLFEYVGIRSYTLYACHFPILAIVSAWLFDTQRGRPSHGFWAIFGFGLSLAFGFACFELCEKRFLHNRMPPSTQADNCANSS